MRRLGSVFLNHREVSAQEAVYRVLSLPLKQLSRKVVYINTEAKENRICLLKPTYIIDMLPDDSEDIYQTNLLDRYRIPRNFRGRKLSRISRIFIPPRKFHA